MRGLNTLCLVFLLLSQTSYAKVKCLNELRNTLNNRRNLLTKATQQKLSLIKAKVSYMMKILDAINPETILSRGYAILTMVNGKSIENRSEVKTGLPLIAKTALGRLHLNASHWEDETEN